MVLMIADKNNQLAQPIRNTLSLVAIPLIKVIEWPQDIYKITQLAMSRQANLIQENKQLKEQLLDAELKVQKNESLATENQRLRTMLLATQNSPLTTSVAFVSNINQTENKQHVVIDQGETHGLFVGQAVLNLAGVIGQVDIEILRTGMRTIAYGNGQDIWLKEIPTSGDIRVGDILVTSGFGNRFPRGLKLAEVKSLAASPNRTFKTALATPFAELDRLTEVFLIWPNQSKQDEVEETTSNLSEVEQEDQIKTDNQDIDEPNNSKTDGNKPGSSILIPETHE